MQNKKTVIIFSGDENRDIGFAIKEYLMEDKTILPMIIAAEELNLALFNIAKNKIVGDAGRANALISLYGLTKWRDGLTDIAKKSPEYNNDKTSHKKMKNIFKRYTPDVVLCLNARCLKAAIAAKNFLRSDTRIAVYFSEHLADRSFIYPEVDVYFVLSDVMKTSLTELGVQPHKIIVNAPISRKRYLNEVDSEIAKGEFKLPKEKPLALILANGHLNYKFSELVAVLVEKNKEYSYLVYCGYDRALLKYLLRKNAPEVIARNEGMDMNLALSAADVVIARPRGEYVAAVMHKEKLFLSYAAETEREKRIQGILSVDLTVAADKPNEVHDILEAYRLKPDSYKKQLKQNKRDPKEAGSRLKDYIAAML